MMQHSITRMTAVVVGLATLLVGPAAAESEKSLERASSEAADRAPAGTASSPSAADAQADQPRQAASNEQISAWIAELDNNQYAVREQATDQLYAAGAPALDALLEAANGDRLEPADRAVWILRRHSEQNDKLLRRGALERLTQLNRRPQVVAAAKETLAGLRHVEAAEAIKELGGQYLADHYPGVAGRIVMARLVLDDRWRGGDEGLKLARDLQGLRQVIIIGSEVTAEGVAELGDVELLSNLLLYGTKLEPQEIPPLKEQLGRVEIDYRRGALLGVGGNPPDGPGPAQVTSVQPGSVAAEAGIRVGDVIRTFNGQPVRDFRDLTEKISEHRPGDRVTLEIVRGGQTLDMSVNLGQWNSEHVLSQMPR